MTKQCELCELPARMFCESDQASLCWECDAKVHGANFLVARHSRRLLCRSCQAPTPWRASGTRLGSTVSVCNRCLGDGIAAVDGFGAEQEETTRDGGGRGGGEEGRRGGLVEEDVEGSGDLGEDDSEEDEDDEDEEDDEEDDDEDGDNQVVPWSMEADSATMASPPPAASCSSGDESSSGIYYGLLKRRREDDDPPSSHLQEDMGCSPSQAGYLRFSAAAAAEPYPGRMLEEEAEEEEASYSGCSFRPAADWGRAVRPRSELAGRPTPPRPAHWRSLSDR